MSRYLEKTVEMTQVFTLLANDRLQALCSRCVVVLDQDADRYTVVRDDKRIPMDFAVADCWYIGAHEDRILFGEESGLSSIVYEYSAYYAAPVRSYRVPFLARCADFFAQERVLISGDDGAAVISPAGVETLFEASALSTRIAHRAVVVDEPYVIALCTDFGVECRRFDTAGMFSNQWTRFVAADSSVSAARLFRLMRGTVAIECAERGAAFVEVVRTDGAMLFRHHVDFGKAVHGFDGTLVFLTPSSINAVGAFDGARQWHVELPKDEISAARGAAPEGAEVNRSPIAFAQESLWVQSGVTLRQYDFAGRERSSFEISPTQTLVAASVDSVVVQSSE